MTPLDRFGFPIQAGDIVTYSEHDDTAYGHRYDWYKAKVLAIIPDAYAVGNQNYDLELLPFKYSINAIEWVTALKEDSPDRIEKYRNETDEVFIIPSNNVLNYSFYEDLIANHHPELLV